MGVYYFHMCKWHLCSQDMDPPSPIVQSVTITRVEMAYAADSFAI